MGAAGRGTLTCPAQAALAVRVPPHLTVGDSVDPAERAPQSRSGSGTGTGAGGPARLQHSHEEGQGGEDAAGVEGVVHLLLRRIHDGRIDHDPPACEELRPQQDP